MNEIVRTDIIYVLNKAIDLVEKKDLLKLRELSDRVIHNASIFQDEDSISVAVIVYSLSKVYKEDEEFDPFVKLRLVKSLEFLEKRMTEDYRHEMKFLFEDLTNTVSSKKEMFNDVLERAEVKKGSKLFYHGISLARAAEALGVSRWELMNYVGKTNIPESYQFQTDIHQKLEFTRGLFSR